MNILAFETSCDETAVAIVRPDREIVANVLHSQIKLHAPYGGIVPELASRSHVEQLHGLLAQALAAAELKIDDIDAVAATRGPGLLGALLVGMNAAQSLAMARNLPFVGVNHLHGHLLSCDLESPMQFPALIWLVTGGHTALYRMNDEHQATLLRRTADDAVGEAFDKVAKMLGLSYPGGPVVEAAAKSGDPAIYALPLPKPRDPRALSLSGLKTAVRRHIESWPAVDAQKTADICSAFQAKVALLLAETLSEALAQERDIAAVYLVGGVARNQTILNALQARCAAANLPLAAPRPALCTDNAAMIARAAWSRLRRDDRDPFDLQPLARWEFGAW